MTFQSFFRGANRILTPVAAVIGGGALAVQYGVDNHVTGAQIVHDVFEHWTHLNLAGTALVVVASWAVVRFNLMLANANATFEAEREREEAAKSEG